jgi:hypothetical protein
MTLAALLSQLSAAGIELWADGDRLKFRPIAAMTPELISVATEHKAELLKALRGEDGNYMESYAASEARRFQHAAIPWPDGCGWYDPGNLQDEAGRIYMNYPAYSRFTDKAKLIVGGS